MNDSNKLLKRAMLLDFVCIALALAVLYVGNKGLVPEWVLILGAVLALAFMCASIYDLMTARRIEKARRKELEEAELKELQKEHDENA